MEVNYVMVGVLWKCLQLSRKIFFSKQILNGVYRMQCNLGRGLGGREGNIERVNNYEEV